MSLSKGTDIWWAPITRDVVRVTGVDATAFLQGQLSQDVVALDVGAGAWSLLLQPNGKIDAWLRIVRAAEDEWALDVDTDWGEAVAARLDRFKLRTKADLVVARAVPFVAVRGRRPEGSLPIVWPGVVGGDIAGPLAPDDMPVAEAHAFELLRIGSGVPALGRELTEATIPAEAGDWLIDASVSFTKGCYTGQELVARVDSRGSNVPRPLRVLEIDGIEPVAVGSEVLDSDGKAVGRVTSAAPDPVRRAAIALGPLSRRVEPGASVTVDGRTATVKRPPTAKA
ncbi:MAG: CAF17-like 4Fe-4S cluster assembly/insertion protein YgfZ [Acidimicrobiia bacterium]